MIEAAIFDFDGTLANTLPDLHTSLNLMRAHFGYSPITETDVLRCVNYATPQYVRLSLPDDFDETRLDEAVEAYYAAYALHFMEKTAPFDGLPALVERLRTTGVKLAAASNKDNENLRALMNKHFPGQFDAVWGTVDGVPPKPDPTRPLLIAEELGFAPEKIAFIGDSDVDMKTAANAGMIPIGVSWGYRDAALLRENGARAIADTADELFDILAAL